MDLQILGPPTFRRILRLLAIAGSSVAVALVVLAMPANAWAAPTTFNVDGVITKSDGQPLQDSSVQFVVNVRSPATANNCLLYSETYTVDMTGSNGYFSLPVGSSTNTAQGGYSLESVFSGQTLSGLAGCDGGASVYSPADSDDRAIQITFTDLGGAHDFGTQDIKAVPFAINAKNLGGKTAAGFLQTSINATQTNVESVFTRYAILDAILAGTYTGNAATATSLAAAPGACPAGKYMTAMTASGAITCGAPAVGSLSSVTSSNSYLTVSNGTSAAVLTLNVGTAAGSVAAGDDARFTDARAPAGAAGGDLSGAYPNPSVAKVSGKAVTLTSPAAGEVLTYDGSKFVNSPLPEASDATKLPLVGGTMTGAIDMGSQNFTNAGYITMSANKSLHLSNNSADPSGLVAADKGKIWYNSTSGEVKYWNGSSAQPLGVAGSGLSNFNTQTGSTQTLAIGSSGLSPSWSSASNVHTLNLPLASGTLVTAGLISKADYDWFAAKLDSSAALAGDVTGTPGTTSVDRIKGKAVTPAAYAAGQTLRYDGTQWVNVVLGFSDLGSKPTTLAGYGITDAQSSTLADGKIFVGNSSGNAAPVTMSGDATLSNSGALLLATVPISKGGTGRTSFAADKLVTTTAAGALQTSFCGQDQVISFTAAGAFTCATVSSLISDVFVQGGNSFGAASSIGTNDNFGFTIKTNNAPRISITGGSVGLVGIGTASPSTLLDVNGAVTLREVTAPAALANQGKLYFDSTTHKFRVSENGGAFVDLIPSGGNGGGVTSITAGAGLLLSGDTDGTADTNLTAVGTLKVDTGTTAGKVVALDASARLPAVDGSQLTNLNAVPGSLVKFDASKTLTNSIVSEAATTVSVAGSLEATGTIVSKAANAGASTTIDFANGNVQYTSSPCAVITLNNLKDGGNYTLGVTGGTGTCDFSIPGLNPQYVGGVHNVSVSSKTVFSFIRMGTDVFITWLSF